MTRHVWLTRRCRPPFFITTSRFTLPVGVGGVSTENQKNRIKTEANALRKVYAIFRLGTVRQRMNRFGDRDKTRKFLHRLAGGTEVACQPDKKEQSACYSTDPRFMGARSHSSILPHTLRPHGLQKSQRPAEATFSGHATVTWWPHLTQRWMFARASRVGVPQSSQGRPGTRSASWKPGASQVGQRVQSLRARS